MATLQGIAETEELTRLRNRVAELENQTREREDALSALQESRGLLDLFLSSIPALAWMKDESGRYVYANSQYRGLIEQSGGECLGATDDDLWPAALAEKFRSADLIAASLPKPQSSMEVLPLPGGERHFQIFRFPFHTGLGKLYIGGIAIDHTARIELEAARRPTFSMAADLRDSESRSRLYESGIAGIIECEGNQVLKANDVLLNWIGQTSEDVASRSLDWRKLTPARFHRTDDLALAEAYAEGSCRPYEKELLNSRGQAVPVIVAISEADRSTGRFVCQILNISDPKQMESRLLRSQKLESLGLIAGGVAHDFNNLLATIMGNASLSLDAVSREHPAYRSLNEVVIASRRASDLTQQVLAYSGRANIQKKPVNLSVAVREIGSLLETTISKKIALRFDLARGLPFVEGYEGQLQQVIMNLVINASDAIGENSGEITVSTRAVGDDVAFEVRDTGCGMSEDTRARIFDPFFTTKTDGRGLGLAAVLGIVRNHSGALLVESEVNKGTTFRVMFPASAAAPLPETAVHFRRDLWGSETVLVADDDEGIRRMARVALERFGYRVLVAPNGEEAVKVFNDHRGEIAAVILDWAMPVMNGDEALERILAIDPGARVLMSSGYAETETLQRVHTRKLAGFVQKPYTTTHLAERLREVIVCNRSSAGTHAGS